MARELTTTSYAILGLLALRGWSTYELAEQMQRALGQFWPRAESGLYEEPKKLVAHGLAEASRELVGKRPRTRYTITPAGRRALRAWVQSTSEPLAGPVLECEPAVKVFFAEHGSKDDLIATLQRVLAWVDQRAVESVDIPRQYLEGRSAFPERLPWLILTGQLLFEFEEAMERWARWALDVVDTWPDDIRAAEPDWAALAEMARRVETRAARAAEPPAAP